MILNRVWILIVVGMVMASCRSEDDQSSASAADKATASHESLRMHSWSGYHWARQTAQFTLRLGDNLTTSDWKGHLANSSTNWNLPSAIGVASTPILTKIEAGHSSRRCSAVAGTTQVCNGKYGNNGWLGLATVSVVGNHITQGTAKMNDSYFNTAPYNNPNEKLHVMCQEVAHTFGLGHQSEDGTSLNTCMDYFSNTGSNATSSLSTTPNSHDFEELTTIYAHNTDTTTTVASSTSAAAQSEVSNDGKSWGELKDQSNSGQSSIYQKVNADGSISVTHVFWTNETAAQCPSCDHRQN